MEEKKKQSDFSIKATFQNWLNLQVLDQAVYLFGNTAVGKTTLCQLIKKLIDNDPNPNLKLVQKKKDFEYECEGEINPKSTKPLTIYPKKYQIKSQNINIIEIPSRIYSLEKKRPYLDKILNVVGLAYASKKACFLFAVDAKNTSGRCDPWKKCFQSILDCFSSQYLNEKTFHSIGFVINKGANQNNKDAYLSRIQDFQKLFAEEERKNQYIQLLKTVLVEKNLSVFTKTTANEQITKRDIKQVFDLMQKLSQHSIPLESQLPEGHSLIKIEHFQLDKQEENCLKNYNSTLEIILDFFSQFFQQIFTSSEFIDILKFQGKSCSNSSEKPKIQENQETKHLLKIIWPKDLNGDLKQNHIVTERLKQLRKKSQKNKCFYRNSIGKASLMNEFKERIQQNSEKNKKTLSQFLQILAQHGLIEQNNQDLPELEALYLELIQYGIFEVRFGSIIKNIDYKELLKEKGVTRQFRDTHKTIVQTEIHLNFMNNKLSLNLSSEQARRYSQVIDKFFPKDQKNADYENSIPLLKKNLLLRTFDRNDLQKGIIEIDLLLDKIINEDKILESVQKNRDNLSVELKKQIEFLNSLALEVAKMLQRYGRPELCAQIFKDCGDYHSAKECYRFKLKQAKQHKQAPNQQETILILNSYLDLLMEMDLFQKALEQCYELSQVYRQIRPEINQKRKQIKANRLKPFDQEKQKQFQERFLNRSTNLSSLYYNKELLSQIKDIAQKNRK